MKSLYQFNSLLEEKALLHAVSKKHRNEEYFFSQALHTGEDSQTIVQNRDKLYKAILLDTKVNIPLLFVVANQTHSNNVTVIDTQHSQGWQSLGSAIKNCDALVSNQLGVVLTILTADCVPLILYDPIQKVVAAIHAGWKGTKEKIVLHTISVMKEQFLTDPINIKVGIAPAIGKCCYEVGEDVALHFFDYPQHLDKKDDKYMLDLPNINKEQLLVAGVLEENIDMSRICTACTVDEYFSYRKEGGCTGRFMSMIGLLPPLS